VTLARWILLLTLAFSFYNVGTVWLTQVSVYPLWKLVGQTDQWLPYHRAWWHSIWGVIFVPAGFALLGAILLMFFRPPIVPAWSLWLGLGIQIITYGLTALVWAPMQVRLDQGGGFHPEVQQTLLQTHWGKVALITLYAVLMLWMTVVGFAGSTN